MGNTLVETPIYEEKESRKLLTPLLDGETATMVVNDPTMRVKKRAGTPILLISPVSVYGMDGDDLVLSLPGYGCEVVTPGEIKFIQLYRLGLTVKAAKILSQTLNELFKRQQ